MDLRIHKRNDTLLSVDCVFEFQTISFSSPGEFVPDLLNFDWENFSHLYGRATQANNDAKLLYQIALQFYQHFSKLDHKLSNLIYSLFFQDTTGQYSGYQNLYQYLPPESNYCAQQNRKIPISFEIYRKIASFKKSIQALAEIINQHYDYKRLLHSFNYIFDFILTAYPVLNPKECFNVIGDWIKRQDSSGLCLYKEYNDTLNKLLAANEKQVYISAFQKLKDILQHANLWDISDHFVKYLEEATLPQHSDVRALSQHFVDTFYRLLKSYEDLLFKSFISSFLFYEHDLSEANQEIYLCEDPLDFLYASFLCCYKYHKPIARCIRCRNYFARSSNAQKICKSDTCNSPTKKINRTLSEELFGKDLYATLNNIYKRLTYSGSGIHYRYNYDAYKDYGITSASSKMLVKIFTDLNTIYVKELDRHVSAALKLYQECSPYLKSYIEMVHNWINEIDAYCRKAKIRTQILQALENTSNTNEQIYIEFYVYHFDVEKYGWDIYLEINEFPITPGETS